ncbi:MAG: HNH endonuclease signature motif containing protein [Acidimicrobiia bacterium]
MTGSATYSRSEDAASAARARLDRVAAAACATEAAQRQLVAELVELWPTSAWLAAGATSAKRWLLTYTGCSEVDAHRLARLAGICHRHPELGDAVRSGAVSVARAHVLGSAANPEREPWLADSLPAFLRLAERGCEDADWAGAVRHWASLVDQERDVRRIPAHSVVLSQRLFGGGEIHGDLSPNAFLNVATALDAWTDDPDPQDAPYQRSLGERRADALDDLCRASLDPDSTRFGATGADDWEGDDSAWEDVEAADTFDGFWPTDDLDEQLAADDQVDPLVLLRRRLRKAEAHRRRRARRRTRSRSGACVNVHIDLRTLADLRTADDLEELVLRGDGWNLTRAAAEQLLCDSALTAVLFDGKGTLLDANDAAEQWSRKQRRAIAARDAGCVFPGCGRPPRHCDIHHLHHRSCGGPTHTGNAAMLCRFHHRLLHHHGWRLLVEEDRWVAIDAHGTRWTGRPTPVASTRGDPP